MLVRLRGPCLFLGETQGDGMTGRHSPRLVTLTAVAAVMAATAFGAAQAQAQQSVSSRFRVLVPDLRHTAGGDKKYGEKLADAGGRRSSAAT